MTTYTEDAAVFIAQVNDTWVYDNITIKHDGPSAYIVYIKGREEGLEDEDMVTCSVPSQLILLGFLSNLTQKRPLFTTLNSESMLYH